MKPSKTLISAATTPAFHYWLIAGQVHFEFGDSIAHYRNLNCIIKTDRQVFGHVNLAKAQQLLQMRLMSENFKEGPPEGFRITDVFTMAISQLGLMTDDEFARGYDDLVGEQDKAANLLDQIRKEAANAY